MQIAMFCTSVAVGCCRGRSGCGVTQPQRSEDGRSRSRSLPDGEAGGSRSLGKNMRGRRKRWREEEKGLKDFQIPEKVPTFANANDTAGATDPCVIPDSGWYPNGAFYQILPDWIKGAPFFL